jgi:hypothetical protein
MPPCTIPDKEYILHVATIDEKVTISTKRMNIRLVGHPASYLPSMYARNFKTNSIHSSYQRIKSELKNFNQNVLVEVFVLLLVCRWCVGVISCWSIVDCANVCWVSYEA